MPGGVEGWCRAIGRWPKSVTPQLGVAGGGEASEVLEAGRGAGPSVANLRLLRHSLCIVLAPPSLRLKEGGSGAPRARAVGDVGAVFSGRSSPGKPTPNQARSAAKPAHSSIKALQALTTAAEASPGRFWCGVTRMFEPCSWKAEGPQGFRRA